MQGVLYTCMAFCCGCDLQSWLISTILVQIEDAQQSQVGWLFGRGGENGFLENQQDLTTHSCAGSDWDGHFRLVCKLTNE